MIGIPLGVDDLTVPCRNDNAASHGAIAADRGGLFGVLDLQGLRVGGNGLEADAYAACRERRTGDFQETSSGDIHDDALLS
jgi:hypothetical protein